MNDDVTRVDRESSGSMGSERTAGNVGLEQAVQWLREHTANTLIEQLGIKIIELTPERVVATMPVDSRTRQPFGLLHGGASVALAETVASLGAVLNIDFLNDAAVGLEINANHLRAQRDGIVTATATPIHRGRTTHVWSIDIVDEKSQRVCISRCTLAIVPQRR